MGIITARDAAVLREIARYGPDEAIRRSVTRAFLVAQETGSDWVMITRNEALLLWQDTTMLRHLLPPDERPQLDRVRAHLETILEASAPRALPS